MSSSQLKETPSQIIIGNFAEIYVIFASFSEISGTYIQLKVFNICGNASDYLKWLSADMSWQVAFLYYFWVCSDVDKYLSSTVGN